MTASQFPQGWRIVPFEEILHGGTRNGIYKPKSFHGSGVKVVNMGELFAHPLLGDVEMRRLEVTDSELDRFELNVGDLLFARRSLVAEGAGKCSIVRKVGGPTVFESSIIRARTSESADPLFVYYFFNSHLGLAALDSIRRQVAVAGITGTDLAKLRVPQPPLREQRAIAGVLGSFDDKIELNRQIAATARQLAHATFQSRYRSDEPDLPHEPLGDHVHVARGLSYTTQGLPTLGRPYTTSTRSTRVAATNARESSTTAASTTNVTEFVRATSSSRPSSKDSTNC